jgi:hypothetical protein
VGLVPSSSRLFAIPRFMSRLLALLAILAVAFAAVDIHVASDDLVGCAVVSTNDIQCFANLDITFLHFDFLLDIELIPKELALAITLDLDGVELESWIFSMESQPELCVGEGAGRTCVELSDVMITPQGFQACIVLTLDDDLISVPLGCYATW